MVVVKQKQPNEPATDTVQEGVGDVCTVTKPASLMNCESHTCNPHFTGTPVDCKINDEPNKWSDTPGTECLQIDSRVKNY